MLVTQTSSSPLDVSGIALEEERDVRISTDRPVGTSRNSGTRTCGRPKVTIPRLAS